MQLYYSIASNSIFAIVFSEGVLSCSLNTTLSNATDFIKVAFKYKENDFALWVNGVEVDTETSSTAFTANSLDVLDFNRGNNSNYFYGNTKQLLYFPSALTDSDLEELTSWTSFNEMATAQQYTIL